MITVGEVVDRLSKEGILEEGFSARIAEGYRAEKAPSSHWSLRIMIGVGAWISAALFLVFLFGMEIVRSRTSSLVTGLFFLVVTSAARPRFMGSVFFRQLFMVLNLSGFAMFLVGLGDIVGSDLALGLGVFFTGVSVIVFYPDRIQRFVAFFVAYTGVLMTIHEIGNLGILIVFLTGLAAAVVFFWEAEGLLTLRWGEGVHRPLAYGLSCSLMTTILFGLADDPGFVLGEIDSGFATGALSLVLAVLAVRADRRDEESPGAPLGLLSALLGVAVLGLLTRDAPGIVASLLLLVLSFRRDNQILLVMSLFFLTVFLGAFYYSMEETLMRKSAILLSTGSVFLVARFLISRVLFRIRRPVDA